MLNNLSITLIITAVTAIASIAAWNNQSLMSKWIMNPKSVNRNGEYHRFITSGFIHADWVHLIFNMFTFYSFGGQLEGKFLEIFGSNGQIYFLLFYLAGIVVSDIPSYLKHKDDANYNSLGASGGVSAILFAVILFYPTSELLIYGIPMKNIVFAVLYTFYTVYQMNRGQDNINHSAHLWGAIFGVVFCLLTYPHVAETFMEDLRNWSVFNSNN
jgi:membrane associated rhomboid family serine protease